MKLIIINGAPGIGKTTVGKLLHNRLSNSAFLDGDDVWRINPFEVNEKTKGLVEKNITLVLRNYLEAGYEYVILAWVLHHQSAIDRLISRLDDLAPKIHIFTLVANEDTLVSRLQADKKIARNPAIARVRLRQSQLMETKKIDTTEVKLEEIVKEIMRSVV
ncbi:MAG: AAA family ATPase [Chloroflexi bacterium]|nr:AAA family ATPase [Chloroflexota bacterium]